MTLSSSNNEDYITTDEIKNALEMLDKDGVASKKRLTAFIDQWPAVVDEVHAVAKRFGALDSFNENLSQIQTRVNDASALADDISSKVRQLDKIRGRVSECQKRVQDLLDLQLCSDGVRTAMDNDELEQAAAHVRRYLCIDQAELRRTADDMAQDCSMITGALKHLQDATEMLRDAVSERFDRASAALDCQSAERYFKIFPLLGMHAAGLDKFVDHLGRMLRTSADECLEKVTAASSPVGNVRGGVAFADGLTFMLEEVAKTIEAQQPLIETHYGPEHVPAFLTLLQRHCDAFSVRLLRAFVDARGIRELSKNVSTMTVARPSADASSDGGGSGAHDAKPSPDPKEVDALVDEVVLILARYDLYAKFVSNRVGEKSTAAAVLDGSELCRSVQELMGRYLELERYYMAESIRKAIELDDATECGGDEGTDGAASTVVDDVFFIVRKCAMRSLRSGSLDVLCAVVNFAVNALEADVCAHLARTLAAGYPTAAGSGGSGYYFNRFAATAAAAATVPDAADRARRAFVAALNNTEVAVEYTRSLSLTFRDEPQVKRLLLLRGGAGATDKLDGCLQDFGRVTASLAAANKVGFRQLHSSLVEPRVHAWMEPFYEQSYTMDELEFARAEADNAFVQTLVTNADAVFREFRAKLTAGNYDALVVAVAGECAAQLERVVLRTEFTRLGGMALDKVVRSLIGYFGAASAWPVRERFTRLVQVTAVLNLEHVADLAEYLSPDGGVRFSWKLTPDAVRQILRLRTDFRDDDIRRIELQ